MKRRRHKQRRKPEPPKYDPSMGHVGDWTGMQVVKRGPPLPRRGPRAGLQPIDPETGYPLLTD